MNISVEMIILMLGVLTFMVNVIVEVTKEFGILKYIKTNYYVVALSITLSVLSYSVYISYSCSKFIWYYFFGAIVLGFMVAYLSMYGWDKLISEWEKSKRGTN